MGLKKRQLNTFSLDYYLPFVLMMLCGRLTESWGIFYSHMIKVDVYFLHLFLVSSLTDRWLLFWPPAFWLPEHHTWSSHPWWMPCVITSRSRANIDVNYDFPLLDDLLTVLIILPFQHGTILPSKRWLLLFRFRGSFVHALNEFAPEWW